MLEGTLPDQFAYPGGPKEAAPDGTPAGSLTPQQKFRAEADANLLIENDNTLLTVLAEVRDLLLDPTSGLAALTDRIVALEAGTPAPTLSGYQQTLVGDSQFDGGGEYIMGQKYPSHTIGRFTYPGQGTQYVLDNLGLPFPGVGAANGMTLAEWQDSTKNGIGHLYIGTNDVVLEGRTASYILGKIAELIAYMRGVGIQKVVVYTLTSLRQTNDSAQIAAREAVRLAVNAGLKAKASPGNALFDCGANAVGDIGSTAELGQQDSATSTYWFQTTDPVTGINLHWGDPAKAIVYEVAGALVTRLQANESGFVISTHTQVQPGGGTGPTAENVVWRNAVGTTATGNTLERTDGAGGFNAGASGTKGFTGDGYFEFELDTAHVGGVVGLTIGDSTGSSYVEIDYGVLVDPSSITPFNSGDTAGGGTSPASPNRHRIERSGTSMLYKLNDGAYFTLTGVSTSTVLVPDCSISVAGGKVINAKIYSENLVVL